jgi:microcompartment protein CcmL/EutN
MITQENVTVLGGIELDSVAAGVQALDAMVKAAPIEIIDARTVCPGKYLILVTGSEASVEAGLAAGSEIRPDCLVDRIYLSNLHGGVIAALDGAAGSEKGLEELELDAVGVLESYTSFGIIEAADRVAKAADVSLLHIRIGDEMGGKASVKLIGPVSEVEAAVAAGVEVLQGKGVLCKQVIIPRPDEQIRRYLTRG